MSMHQPSKGYTDFRISKEFDSWRGLESDETYTCVIEVLPTARIIIELDIVKFSVTPEVAKEISSCLREALAIDGDDEGDRADVENRSTSLFKVRRTIGIRGLQYSASGEITIEDASGDVCEGSPAGTTSIVVCTIEGGGYELVFPFMCYSFTEDDTFWLSEGLFRACQETAKP
ncbi:hypothetical protein E5170_09615 [Pseudomonas atacamensis]|uniref:Uncharacterized protein n=1 Tax=Pseudomonas atacamensis TaxID=2565368 RepID=A0AAQ2DEY0_9PSED|nr:hypothetical protein [Pseudomonas atacamensis]THF34503.1 hypothetical protein E5170_09615 [Pseudomonas atacamensis]